MKLITLTQGKFAQVDDADFEWLNQYKWHAYYDKGKWYARRYISGTSGIGQKNISMHRMILELNDSSLKADHKDSDGLNNQRCNLRAATPYQNVVNRKAVGRSKYLGVFMNTSKYKGKTYIYWQGSIQKNGVKEHLGCFKKETDAALAYNEAAKKIHGEFAKLNII